MSAENTVTFHQSSYVCMQCGATIPANYVHICPQNNNAQFFPVSFINYDALILAELQAIRALLEKMHTQKTG